MPVLTKINTNVIADNAVTAAKIPAGAVDADIQADAVTSAKIAPDIVLTGGSVTFPSVSTANLPGAGGGTNASQTATNGMLVYNTTLGMLQQRSAGTWKGIASSPSISSFTYSDGASATAEKTVVGLVSVSCTTQTSTTVLVPGASLGIQVGMVVAGTGIPAGATVVSVIEDTSFVLSSAATASATVTLTFGGVVTITGTNFDSILAGGSANIGVTFDGTSATSISVNSLKTIITCTPPAHAAGTISLLITNASGLTASTNFVYDEEAIFTTAAGSLGSFPDATYTANADAPRIQATDGEGSPSALTTGFERVTSASDDTVITTTIQGLTVLTSGYLTGTLSATEGTTYPFYATAKDSQNQRTAPRLFNIISAYAATGGLIGTPYGSYRIHIFGDTSPPAANATTVVNFVVSATITADILILAGGGGGAAGPTWLGNGGSGAGAGGMLELTSQSLAAGTYVITVGGGGAGGDQSGSSSSVNISGSPYGRKGENSTVICAATSYSKTAYGGGHGTREGGSSYATMDGGSGGGTNSQTDSDKGYGTYSGSNAGSPYNVDPRQGYDGAIYRTGANGGNQGTAGGGGGAGVVGTFTGTGSSGSGSGGAGRNNAYRTGSNIQYGGGGGGASYTQTSGAGGAGGGGAGNTGGHGYAGTAKLGGGGGGGQDSTSDAGNGGAGGSGIVIIRYAV
jgi:hypothetical protein